MYIEKHILFKFYFPIHLILFQTVNKDSKGLVIVATKMEGMVESYKVFNVFLQARR